MLLHFDICEMILDQDPLCGTICNKHRSVMILLHQLVGGGREGERMKSIDGPELSAPYLYHNVLSLHNYDWSDISVLLAAPLYGQLDGVQAHSSDRGVLKGVVTQSSH